jgi:hypothetical protein
MQHIKRNNPQQNPSRNEEQADYENNHYGSLKIHGKQPRNEL